MWQIWLAAGTGIFALSGAGTHLCRHVWRRARDRAAIEAFRASPAGQRCENLSRLIDSSPDNAFVWYLLACDHLRAGRVALAARAFGLAYHADARLESAALMTFACLKASSQPAEALVPRLIETWHELRRPAIGQRAVEEPLLTCLAATTRDAPRLSSLGRLAWLTASPLVQSQIEQAQRSLRPDWSPLWIDSPDDASAAG